jgi:hypothetical protein
MPPLPTDEYNPFYLTYLQHVHGEDYLEQLKTGNADLFAFLDGIRETDAEILHPPYTWNAKQVVGHLTDSERVFAYRALRICRDDATPLAGFDENAYVNSADFSRRSFAALRQELLSVRAATISLFESFTPADWLKTGTANKSRVSTRALAAILVGHMRHHGGILKKRFQAT